MEIKGEPPTEVYIVATGPTCRGRQYFSNVMIPEGDDNQYHKHFPII